MPKLRVVVEELEDLLEHRTLVVVEEEEEVVVLLPPLEQMFRI